MWAVIDGVWKPAQLFSFLNPTIRAEQLPCFHFLTSLQKDEGLQILGYAKSTFSVRSPSSDMHTQLVLQTSLWYLLNDCISVRQWRHNREQSHVGIKPQRKQKTQVSTYKHMLWLWCVCVSYSCTDVEQMFPCCSCNTVLPRTVKDFLFFQLWCKRTCSCHGVNLNPPPRSLRMELFSLWATKNNLAFQETLSHTWSFLILIPECLDHSQNTALENPLDLHFLLSCSFRPPADRMESSPGEHSGIQVPRSPMFTCFSGFQLANSPLGLCCHLLVWQVLFLHVPTSTYAWTRAVEEFGPSSFDRQNLSEIYGIDLISPGKAPSVHSHWYVVSGPASF